MGEREVARVARHRFARARVGEHDVEPGVLQGQREREAHEAEHERGDAAWTPRGRDRTVSTALQVYAAFTTSAARGAVRDLSQMAPTHRPD